MPVFTRNNNRQGQLPVTDLWHRDPLSDKILFPSRPKNLDNLRKPRHVMSLAAANPQQIRESRFAVKFTYSFLP